MTRNDICHIINDLNLTGIGVEIGVRTGAFSDVVLSNTNLSMLISIDVWNDTEHMSQTLELLKKYGKRSTMLRQSSLLAASLFPDDMFDFIYLDSNHSYNNVKREIELYWPKLKSGGIFSGHDYVDGWKNRQGKFLPFGVIQAVDEFVEREDQILHLIDPRWPSWWLVKDGDWNDNTIPYL